LNSNAVTKISNTGVVTMLAGGNQSGDQDGTGTAASFYHPTAVEVDAAGNIYVSDSRNNKLRKITPAGVVTTVFPGNLFKFPFGLRFDNNGNLILCDSWNNKLLRITPAGIVTTIAASGIPDYFTQVGEPQAVTVDGNNNIYFTDGNNKIHWILPSGELRTAIPNETVNLMQGIAIDKNGVIFASDYYNDRIVKITIK
jgi:streptogramin lyase